MPAAALTLEQLAAQLAAARSERKQDSYLALTQALVQYVNAQRAAALPAEQAQAVQALVQDCHRWEATWALLLGELLWEQGRQDRHAFSNHWNLCVFAGAKGPHSLIDSASHARLAREMLNLAQFPALYVWLGNALRALGEFAAAEDCYLAGQQRYPDYPFLRVRLGDLYLATCRVDQAQAVLEPLQGRFPAAREMLFLGPAHAAPPSTGPAMQPLPSTAREMVLLLAADPVYLEKYGERLLSSMPVTAMTRLHVHFHVLMEDEAALEPELARRLAARCTSSYFSVRRSKLAALPPETRRTLYACERFLILPDLLEAYGKPVLVLDIDLECVGDPFDLLVRLGAADLAVGEHAQTREAWERYAASTVLARPQPAVLDFFRRMRNYLMHQLNRHPAPWFLDQVALFRMLEEGAGAPCAWRVLRDLYCTRQGPPGRAMFRVLHASWDQEAVGGT